jgi:predicted glycosyltransferase
MNREAATLGVPVYSIFRGKTGAVDYMLEQEGRLIIVQSVEEVWTKIRLVRREKNKQPDSQPRPALQDIINRIEDIIRIEQKRLQKSKLLNEIASERQNVMPLINFMPMLYSI